MCGIFGSLSSETPEFLQIALDNLSARGPDNKSVFELSYATLGFTRLAINGIHDGNQPFIMNEDMRPHNHGTLILVCNGEIYNYRELYRYVDTTPNTHSDCEIILHLYKKYGIKQTLYLLHGVYAFILLDIRDTEHRAYIARDPFGVRPLYQQSHRFASELKAFLPFGSPAKITHFPPATCHMYTLPMMVNARWTFTKSFTHYHLPHPYQMIQHSVENLYTQIFTSLFHAVERRVYTTERPIACLLSGGLDSSLITAMVSFILKREGKQVNTFSIGMPDGEDLRYARMVAEHIGSNHHELILSEAEFIEAIPNVIYAIESYDTTTVRASVGNYLIAEYISKHTDCKVVFNGDGSDEVCGGYMYFHYAPSSIAFDNECRRLLKELHQFDVLRSDRSVASHGLEARTPFLDKDFVSMYMSIPCEIRNHTLDKQCEKYLLRKSVEHEMPSLLPTSVLWRMKEAFSDGVSKQSRSWYEIIQETVQNRRFRMDYTHMPPSTNEQAWYRYLWEDMFPENAYPANHFWMPRFVDAKDASARTLQKYRETLPSHDSHDSHDSHNTKQGDEEHIQSAIASILGIM